MLEPCLHVFLLIYPYLLGRFAQILINDLLNIKYTLCNAYYKVFEKLQKHSIFVNQAHFWSWMSKISLYTKWQKKLRQREKSFNTIKTVLTNF